MTKKSVLITGSGIGIGRATAIRFAQEGYHVFVSDILLAESEAVVSEIKADGGSATAVYLDVTDKISVEEALRSYTMNNAYAAFWEKTTGSIERGKNADFVVHSENLLTIEPDSLLKSKVLRTVIAGKDYLFD